jgi:hypothetical protein
LHAIPEPDTTDALTVTLRGQRLVESFSSFLERHGNLAAGAFSVLFILVSLLRAATKLMWFDELFTWYPARLPSVSNVLSFYRDGIDAHTATAALILRGAIAVFGDHPATNRLPFALGYLLMCVCIYRFVSRHSPAVYAIAAMIFPALTGVVYYATEIRGYAIELGMTGLALVCWQEAAAGRHRVLAISGLFLSLAAAISCHYYAALLWIPFGLAEITRFRIQRRPDIPMYLALFFSPVPLLFFLPGMRASQKAYGAGIWARPYLGQILDSYREILTLSLAPLFLCVVLWILLIRFRTSVKPERSYVAGPAERVLVGSLALLPAIGVPLSFLAGIFVWRYVLPAVAGLTIFLILGMCRILRGDLLAGSLLVVSFFGWFGYKSVTTIRIQAAENGGLRIPLAQPLLRSSWVRELERSTLPVAVVPAVFFLKLQHYAPEPLRSRLIYPVSEKLALKYEGIYTGETNLLQFSRRVPIHIAEYRGFARENKHFLLCAETTNPTWLIEKLIDDGARLELRKRVQTYFVFDVTYPDGEDSTR